MSVLFHQEFRIAVPTADVAVERAKAEARAGGWQEPNGDWIVPDWSAVMALRELAVHVVFAHPDEFHELAQTISDEWNGTMRRTPPISPTTTDPTSSPVQGGEA